MKYSELLNQEQWWHKCNEILNRDHYICKDCGCFGYHNRGNFMKIQNLQELNFFFKEWRFQGKVFSEFVKDMPLTIPQPAQDITLSKEHILNDVIVYELSWPLFVLSFTNCQAYPLTTRFVLNANRDISINDAKFYYLDKICSKIDNPNIYGWGYLLEFNEPVSDNIYVNVENKIVERIDDEIFEQDIINITFGSKLLALRFSHSSFGLRGLNIHHTYYIEDLKPWEYDNDSLVTLCEECHKKRHQTTNIPLYNVNHKLIQNLIPCDRCGGSGYLPQYNHVEHGICFKCNGEGVII